MRQNIITLFYLRGNKGTIKFRMIDSMEDFINCGKKYVLDITEILWTFIRQINDYSHDKQLVGNLGDYLAKNSLEIYYVFAQ